MDLSFLYDNRGDTLPLFQKKKKSLLERLGLRRRKPDADEEIAEIHDLILNVYEAMDDQARAVLLSLSKVVQDEEESVTIEEKVKALVGIGHTLCCAHTQVKKSTKLYTKLLVRALSHYDIRMRLAAIIAITEGSIDNLTFQMKLNEIGVIPKLFELMKDSMPYAGRTLNDINEHSKTVAWCCYSIVNICTNCIPNILLLKDIVPIELETLNHAARMEIWRCIWRENYAQTIVCFGDSKIIHITTDAIQPEPYVYQNSQLSATRPRGSGLITPKASRLSFSVEYHWCTIT